MDKISSDVRSRNMSHIRGKNTNPEMLIRKALFSRGLRYRIHYHLSGKPDIVFPTKKIAIFIHGCFWHGHRCNVDHEPKSNSNFWLEKKNRNRRRDKITQKILTREGWKVLVFWECQILKDSSKVLNHVTKILQDKSGHSYFSFI